MNETNDPLEDELSAFRPIEVSPELRRRIAERLAHPAPLGSRRPWTIALAGAFAAAGLAAILLGWGVGPGVHVDHTRQADVGPPPAAPAPRADEVEDPLPTLQAYRRAAARSPEDLDALL